jgi:hypothetical protein
VVVLSAQCLTGAVRAEDRHVEAGCAHGSMSVAERNSLLREVSGPSAQAIRYAAQRPTIEE